MDRNRLEELLDLYLDGELSPEERNELQTALLDDPEARRQFWARARFHGLLRLTGEQPSSGTGAIGPLTMQSQADDTSSRVPQTTFAGATLWKSLVLLVVCAALLGGFWRINQFAEQDADVAKSVNSPDNGGIESSADSVVDPFLAIIIEQSADAKWGGTDAPAGLGHAIRRGRTVLETGESSLRLDNGVELKLRGPTELTLLSVDHGVIHRGQVSARVPEWAIGFRLDGPGINVVDLGTEFSLSVDESGAPKVHVFDGKVRATLRARLPGAPSTQADLLTGDSVGFDVGLASVTHGDSDLRQFPRLNTEVGLPTTSGNIAYLRQAPQSVRVGTFEHDSILVFQEHDDVVLPQDIRVVRGATNQYRASEPSVPEYLKLSVGTHVQSYCVHMDQIGDQGGFNAIGRVRFEQPILGFIVEWAELARTDRFLRHDDVTYGDGKMRHVEMRYCDPAPDNHDEIYLSEDGHELRMTLRIGPNADQFRILVAGKTDE